MTTKETKSSPRMRSGPGIPLVADTQFILAMRDTGYRDMASALSELIDNAIEANAKTIDIEVREERENGKREVSLAVVDDGDGMDRDALKKAVQFGGTTRFNSRRGLGRFGMGLPNSSVSQGRRLDLYSWTSHSACFHTYLDVDELSAGTHGLPLPFRDFVPFWVNRFVKQSGTAVIWSRCDRIDFRKAATIQQKLSQAIGQRYRYHIWSDVSIFINSHRVDALDPLCLKPSSRNPVQATLVGKPLVFDVVLPVSARTTRIHVCFSELPVQALTNLSNREKRELGIVGGAGVSFVRAGREIDYGWMLLGTKRKENYDDWWRCELRFDPEADELFGITHSKQGVTPSRHLREAVSAELEGIARELNSRARAAFHALRDRQPSTAVRAANRADGLLPVPIGMPPARVHRDGISYEIGFGPLETPAMFTAALTNGVLLVTINTAHPFYQSLYLPLRTFAPEMFNQLEAFVLAAARASALSEPSEFALRDYHHTWANTYAAFASEL